MEFDIIKNDLMNGLKAITSTMKGTIFGKDSSNFLIKSHGMDSVEFYGSNYDMCISGKFPAYVKEEGSVSLSSQKMYSVCKLFKEGLISIKTSPDFWATVQSGNAKMNISTIDPALCPAPKDEDVKLLFKSPIRDINRASHSVLFAAQVNESRRNLMGAHLKKTEDGVIQWETTDGHRLAKILMEASEMDSEVLTDGIIVPRKFLYDVIEFEGLFTKEVEVYGNNKMIRIVSPEFYMESRLLEGTFPNTDPIIPKDNPNKVIINRKELLESMRLIMAMSNDQIKPVLMTFKENTLVLEGEKSEQGNIMDQFDVEYDSSEEIKIGFNTRYWLDILNILSSDKIVLSLKDAMSPGLIQEEGNDSYLSVMMPMRIEW